MGSFSRVCAGTSVPSARGVAASFLTRCRGSRLLRPRRCGDFGLVSRHKPAEHRFLMFPLLPTLKRRVSDAEERLRNQRFFHAEERLRNQRPSHAGERLREQRFSHAGLRDQRLSQHAILSWTDRGHHVPALTVTSGGRGVGFDMHARGRLDEATSQPSSFNSVGGHPSTLFLVAVLSHGVVLSQRQLPRVDRNGVLLKLQGTCITCRTYKVLDLGDGFRVLKPTGLFTEVVRCL